MLWLAITGPGTTSITPIDGLSDSVTGYLFGYGPLGICFVAMAWLFLKGFRLTSPKAVAAIRAEARKDLIAERDRVIAEKHEAERERDEALRIATQQLMPLLGQFTAATQSLLPVLQSLVGQGFRARHRDDDE